MKIPSETLIIDDPGRLFLSVFNCVSREYFDKDTSFENGLSKLTESERIVILLGTFVADVQTSGLSCFLSYQTGNYAEEIYSLLKQLGADDAASSLYEYRLHAFKDAPIPSEYELRREMLFDWEEENEDLSQNIAKRTHLGDCVTVRVRVGIYIKENVEKF